LPRFDVSLSTKFLNVNINTFLEFRQDKDIARQGSPAFTIYQRIDIQQIAVVMVASYVDVLRDCANDVESAIVVIFEVCIFF